MELTEALRRRRMVRNFTTEPVDDTVLRGLLDRSRRSPSAGNTAAAELVVLRGPDETARYWDITLPAPRRAGFPWPGLLHAPVLVLVTSCADRYLDRYSEPDKAAAGLGDDPEAWPVPYWDVDAGFVVMALLLGAVDLGLGALFFGLFDGRDEVMETFDIPANRSIVGVIALGHPAEDRPSRSAQRRRPPLDDVVHWGSWDASE